MKDLGEVDTILGIKVKRHSEGFCTMSISLCGYITKFNHLGIKEVNTPLDILNKLFENIGKFISQLEYASTIGSLMYTMHCTRPDIAFTIDKLLRYTHNHNVDH